MRAVASRPGLVARIGGRLLSNLSRRGRAIGLGYKLSGLGSILVFHEIHDDPDAELRSGCSSGAFASLISTMCQSGIDFVTMDEALLRIDDNKSKPFVTVTFDDGYRDTYECALPILERFNVPFTVYVPTRAVTRELYAWWLGLRMLFQKQDVVTIDPMHQRFRCIDLRSKIAALRVVSNWVGNDFRLKDALRETFKSNGISLEALSDQYFLNSEELRRLAHRPIAVIGAHTTSHAALSLLSREDMEAEMSDNRNFLENLTGTEVLHFAYPYGTDRACGDREFSAAARLGFKSGVTAINRSILHGSSKHALPRLDLTGRFWTSGAGRLPSDRYSQSGPLDCHDASAESKFLWG
jgi:peptidoglycan/xylan/chitin deacetylase (PgdA/CDA1 family)